ncbi:mismatch-specific DNA-glycosylase [Candidatus Parcubacteria bacterium]|nr:mismatch-specific DNA-glycosylase [Candidatus Parcubacteria bacterium]
MTYKIKFRLNDIQSDSNDPWELHFGIEKENENIKKQLKKDFTFKLNNDWIVSANKTKFRGRPYWFIRGSIDYVSGNKKYYKKESKTFYHKKYFNKELIENCPQIKEKNYEGEFDMNKKIMTIRNPILEDLIKYKLNIIFCGMAAGKISAEVGGYYTKSNNKFWGILHELGLTTKNRKLRCCEYKELLDFNIGLTDLVKDQIGGDNNVNVTEHDYHLLRKKIIEHRPKILAFNGKKSAKKFFHKREIDYGKINNIGQTSIWVLESTSPAANRWWNNGKHWKQLAQKNKKIY